MIIPSALLISNPFVQAYSESDLLGKAIFIGLYFLSCLSWAILLQKIFTTFRINREKEALIKTLKEEKSNLLSSDTSKLSEKEKSHPFFSLFTVAKKNTLELLTKNRHFLSKKEEEPKKDLTFLSEADIHYIEVELHSMKGRILKELEKNLFILSTAVTLAPFLGLLGTVWGILATFSAMQHQSAQSSSVIAGLSLALATTVVGLIVAIPALVGYNILRNQIRQLDGEMQHFSREMVAAIELQYRHVDERL